MFYTIYKITNKLNGKIYIGKHQAKDLNDGYMGSGKHLKRAINKHGIENFTKEILFQFDNEDEMNAKEAELVTEEFCLREDTYNLCPGGNGGFGYINNSYEILSKRDTYENKLAGAIAANKVINEKYEDRGFTAKKLKTDDVFAFEFSKKVSQGLSKYYENNHGSFLGKTHSEETKIKMQKSRGVGSNNSQYGTCWITNGTENKKIRKEEEIPTGWKKGRK